MLLVIFCLQFILLDLSFGVYWNKLTIDTLYLPAIGHHFNYQLTADSFKLRSQLRLVQRQETTQSRGTSECRRFTISVNFCRSKLKTVLLCNYCHDMLYVSNQDPMYLCSLYDISVNAFSQNCSFYSLSGNCKGRRNIT